MLLECQIHNESFMVAFQEQYDFLVYYVHNSVAVKCIKFVIKKKWLAGNMMSLQCQIHIVFS